MVDRVNHSVDPSGPQFPGIPLSSHVWRQHHTRLLFQVVGASTGSSSLPWAWAPASWQSNLKGQCILTNVLTFRQNCSCAQSYSVCVYKDMMYINIHVYKILSEYINDYKCINIIELHRFCCPADPNPHSPFCHQQPVRQVIFKLQRGAWPWKILHFDGDPACHL